MRGSEVHEPVASRRLILGYDGGCFTCTGLARRIEEQVGGELEVLSLSDPHMQAWRRKALGEQAPWTPTLVEIKDLKVRAWTGPRMAVTLTRRLGPAATWRVMQALGEIERPAREPRQTVSAVGMSRKRFLKGTAGAMFASSVFLSNVILPQKALGQSGFTTGTLEQQRLAKTIVRNSSQYGRLANLQAKIGASFNFNKANFKFRKALGLVAVYSAGRGRGIIAIFFVDMRRKVVFTYNHQVWLPNSSNEDLQRADVLSYSHGEAAGKFHHIVVELLVRDRSVSGNLASTLETSPEKQIYDSYVISDDGRRRNVYQFNEFVKLDTQRSRSTAQVTSSSSCQQCRNNAELFCEDVQEFQCAAIDALGGIGGGCAIGAIITLWSGPGAGAGCAVGGVVGGIAGAVTGIGCGIYNNHISAGGSGCSAYSRSASGGCIGICSGNVSGSTGSGVCTP